MSCKMSTPDSKRIDLKGIARQAMLDRGLVPDFSAAALAQLGGIERAADEPGAQLRDLRARLWSSIDNDESRDLDQLEVAEPQAGDVVKILVAIADVDAIIRVGSPIDDHARINTTSVYTAAQIFPMLPEKLSTNLTSLNADEDRIALVIEMSVSAAGAVVQSDVYRALVRNRAKLAYNSVSAWLEGQAPPPPPVAAVSGMAEQLRLQDKVAQALKQLRHTRGALSLETIEAQAVFENGELADLRLDPKNRAKELIEDFMIAANGVTAQFLAARGCASLRRVLRAPERWARIVALARDLGTQLPAQPDAPALDAFLTARRQSAPERFADLSLAVVKLLGRGEYVVQRPGASSPGHFGLAVSQYTHSTAPNRRFPDLIGQRLLKAGLADRAAPYADADLEALAAHCTQQEDNAARVERQVAKSAAALLLAGRVGQRFDAIVTGVTEAGTWVRISAPIAEGKLIKGFQGVEVGEHVRVQLIATDVPRGFIDFARTQ
jgi:exoribonuclease-2